MRNNVDRVYKEWSVFKIIWDWRRHMKHHFFWWKGDCFLSILSDDDAILVSLTLVILINIVAFAKISTPKNVVLI